MKHFQWLKRNLWHKLKTKSNNTNITLVIKRGFHQGIAYRDIYILLVGFALILHKIPRKAITILCHINKIFISRDYNSVKPFRISTFGFPTGLHTTSFNFVWQRLLHKYMLSFLLSLIASFLLHFCLLIMSSNESNVSQKKYFIYAVSPSRISYIFKILARCTCHSRDSHHISQKVYLQYHINTEGTLFYKQRFWG